MCAQWLQIRNMFLEETDRQHENQLILHTDS